MRDISRTARLALCLALCAFGLVEAPAAHAATFTVTSTADGGAGSLRAALVAAQSAGSGAHTINVDVTGTVNLASSLTYSNGGTLTIHGNGLIVDGSDSYRVLNSNNGAVNTLVLEDMTLSGGDADSNGGGAILQKGPLTLRRVVIRSNRAIGHGGGIRIDGGDLQIYDSRIEDNVAAKDGGSPRNGGGVYAGNNKVTVRRSTFSGNAATKHGGGIEAKHVDILNSTFYGNEAGRGSTEGWGGGIKITPGSLPAAASVESVIRSTTFYSNETPPPNGTQGAAASLYGGRYGVVTVEGVVMANPIGSPNCSGLADESGSHNDVTLTENNNYAHQDGDMGANIEGNGGRVFCGFNHASSTMSGVPGGDPQLGALGNHGGLTQTMIPAADSPLVATINGGILCAGTDQRGSGYNRPGSNCDIGSVERDATGEPPPTTTTSVVPPTTPTMPPKTTPTTQQPKPPTKPSPSRFVALPPKRLFDTRAGNPTGKLAPGQTISIPIRGSAGVPASAKVKAVVLNLTATESSRAGYVTAFATGRARPTSSNLNLVRAGQTAPNLVTVPIGNGGRVSFFSQGGTHLLADVSGYFIEADAARSGRFVSLPPKRVFDTRNDRKPSGFVAAGRSITVAVAGKAGIPAKGVSALALNITAVDAARAGYVTAYPANRKRPLASTLNLDGRGHIAANMAIVPIGRRGKVTFFSHAGAHLIADVAGYFTDDDAKKSSSGLFVDLAPKRVFDTRTGPPPVGALGRGSAISVQTAGRGGVPKSGVSAVFLNVTATNAGAGFVTVWPTGSARPTSSNLNLTQNGETRANAAMARLGAGGRLSYYSQGGAHLLADAFGYFRT